MQRREVTPRNNTYEMKMCKLGGKSYNLLRASTFNDKTIIKLFVTSVI
jgi:hypothetical protein